MKHRSDFDRVLAAGRRRRIGAVVIARAPGREGCVRYGLVAGRKMGGAVDRNRAKRRLRHAIGDAHLHTGYDYVVFATPEVLEVPYEALVRCIRRADEESGRD